MLRKGIEPDAARSGVVVDADHNSEPVDFTPCVLILWKFLDKSDGRSVFDPPSVRTRNPVSEHPESMPSAKDVKDAVQRVGVGVIRDFHGTVFGAFASVRAGNL
jgi:hypothetical protein